MIIKTKENKNFLKASDYSIEQYFSKYERIIIPIYQRGYAWEEKNMITFIKDINCHEEYYIGNIMTIENHKEKGEIEIIDGQQRLISIFLILCSLKNDFEINVDKKIKLNNGFIIKIGERSSLSQSKLLESIYRDSFPTTCEEQNEYKVYKKINKIIKNNNIDPFIIFNHILNLRIVEIKILSKESKAHDTFVNLNTKGKVLSDIEIIKSHFFRFLINEEWNANKYKENWHTMLEFLGDKNYQKYFDDFVDICLPLRKPNEKRLDVFLENVNDVRSANKWFNFFTKNDYEINCFCNSASAIFNHNLECIRENIDDGNFSFDELDLIIKLFNKSKFRQFDVVLISLLYFKDRKAKRRFIRKFQYIKTFLIFILMHQTILSINKTSPSTYGNVFKSMARELYFGKDIKETSKDFIINNLKILDEAFIKKTIIDAKIMDNTYQAKLVIQLLNDDYRSDLTIDHFMKRSGNNINRFLIGNCVPVSQDNFGNINIENKIEKYHELKDSENYIKDFLNFGITTENCETIIKQRTNQIADNYAKKYSNLIKALIK